MKSTIRKRKPATKKQIVKVSTLRNSAKEVFRQSPEDYEDFHLTFVRQRQETELMRWGQIFHQEILEPDKEKEYVIIPPEALNSQGHRKGKQWAEFKFKNEGKSLLKPEEFASLGATIQKAIHHPRAKALLDNETGKREYQLEAEDEDGLVLTGRADLLIPGRAIVDFKLKTSGTVDTESFWKTVRTFGYHRQAAWYVDLWEKISGEELPFVFIFCQLDKSHQIRCYELDRNAIERGREQNQLIMKHFYQCRNSGVWKSAWADEIYTSIPPAYLLFPEDWEITLNDYL